MSGDRLCDLLLRLYPAGWRARYGAELADLVLESSAGKVRWQVRADVARAALVERLRAAGLAGDGPPEARMRGGVLLVLRAWMVFVVAGLVVQKASEHWQDATPVAGRGVPTAAFDTLAVTAAIGGVLVLVGVAAALPGLLRLRADDWSAIRGRLVAAAASTVATVAAAVVLGVWAHSLTAYQRNGHDAGYGALFLAWVALTVVCLSAWTSIAVAVAFRLDLSRRLLALEARLAAVVTAAMLVMTIATGEWWASLAQAAPWFFAGRPVGSAASALEPQLLIGYALMLVASLLAAGGSYRALRARRG